MLTLLIVDDHEPYRSVLAQMLTSGAVQVCGAVGDGESAVEEVARLRPDLVLLDVQLPGMDGFAVADRIADRPRPPVVVLTSSRDAADYGERLEEAPVAGFVPKHEMSVDALRRVLQEAAEREP